MPIGCHGEALDFLRTRHYAAGCSNTSTFRYGLYRSDSLPMLGVLWGVAVWIPPTRGAAVTVLPDNPDGVLCLSRLCIDSCAPANAASFLLGRSMKLVDRTRYPALLTYADTGRGHSGAIYRATNWQEIGAVAAGDTWIDSQGVQRGRKRGGITLTRDEMIAQGLTRLPQLPKIKFVHCIK